MSDKAGSKIEWTDVIWEPVGGCRHASEGCRNCYAETLLGNLAGITPSRFRPIPRRYDDLVQIRSKRARFTGEIAIWPEKLVQPLSWRKPRTVFVCSQSDLFYEERPFEHIAAVYAVMAATPHIRYLMLTKRPERRREFFAWIRREAETALCNVGGMLLHYLQVAVNTEMLPPRSCAVLPYAREWIWPNIGEGVSVEDQATADERIPVLLDTPAAMRFVSYEPALSGVDFEHLQYRGEVEINALGGTHGVIRPHRGKNEKLDWIIVGAESGPGARSADLDWFRSVRDQCSAAGVPFFLKQAAVCEDCQGTGGVTRYGIDQACPTCEGHSGISSRVRKGCPALDGKVHDARPEWIAP